MIVSVGEKLHVIARRRFDGDLRRHFAGVVEDASETLVRARGFVFVFDESANEFVCHDVERTKIFGLEDAGLVINVLPAETVIGKLRYMIDNEGRRVITDGRFSLNVTEFSARR